MVSALLARTAFVGKTATLAKTSGSRRVSVAAPVKAAADKQQVRCLQRSDTVYQLGRKMQ